jgi:hypothetical protein
MAMAGVISPCGRLWGTPSPCWGSLPALEFVNQSNMYEIVILTLLRKSSSLENCDSERIGCLPKFRCQFPANRYEIPLFADTNLRNKVLI